MLLTLKKLIYPHKCIVCRSLLDQVEEEGYVCPKCRSGILREAICPICSRPYSIAGERCLYCKHLSPAITQIISIYPYKNEYKQSILRWKYKGIRKYGKGFARIIYEEKEQIKDLAIEGLIPVPISKKRYRERGFNQTLDLAVELGSYLDIPVYDILARNKNTKPQSACSKEERRKNIRGTIKVSEIPYDIIDNKQKVNLAIIDDIYTTGSTIEECIRALYEQENLLIDKIYVLVVCIAV